MEMREKNNYRRPVTIKNCKFVSILLFPDFNQQRVIFFEEFTAFNKKYCYEKSMIPLTVNILL